MTMEQLEMLGQFLAQFGFPIMVCFICFYYIAKMEERHSNQIDLMHQTHKNETDSLSAALNNNTLVMQRLLDKLNSES